MNYCCDNDCGKTEKNAMRNEIYGGKHCKSRSHTKTLFNKVINRHFLDQYM